MLALQPIAPRPFCTQPVQLGATAVSKDALIVAGGAALLLAFAGVLALAGSAPPRNRAAEYYEDWERRYASP